MPWHGRRPAGVARPSVVPALLAALALLLGLPLASPTGAEATRLVGGRVVVGSAVSRVDQPIRSSSRTPELVRAVAHRFGAVDTRDHLAWADLVPPTDTLRFALLEVAPVVSAGPMAGPIRSTVHSRAPPLPDAPRASGIPLSR